MNNYLGIWRQLNRFVISLDSRMNLSWEDKTALFGAHLVENGVQSTTLKSYFSAIKFILKQDGYQWDDGKMLLSSLIKGCKRGNDSLKIRLPIQNRLVEMLLFEVERYYGGERNQHYLEALYKAMICLAYYGMMRVGEITNGDHTLKAPNIHLGHNKDKILIVLYTSKKHGKESRPQRIKISAIENENAAKPMTKAFFCPCKTVNAFMEIRGDYIEDDEQFFIFRDGSPVLPGQFRNMLRLLLKRLGLNSALYDVHSFRAGRTVDLYKFGYSIERIKVIGRWRSNAIYNYLKLSQFCTICHKYSNQNVIWIYRATRVSIIELS